MSSLSNFAIVASHKLASNLAMFLKKKHAMRRRPEKKEKVGKRQTGSGDSDRERESADSWDGSRGASIDPGE